MVAPRSRKLTQLFACPGELPPGQDDPRGQTRLWAVKEAILKLLGLGLAASPREIQTHPWLCFTGRARQRWLELDSPTLLPAVKQIDDSVVAVVHT
jgi:phosphopantetheinyl transferase